MTEDGVRKKRKRSAVACIGCHDRKVRCNVSWQGIPCSNCVEDGVTCDIYRRETHIPKRRHSTVEGHSHPLSPSSTLTHSTVQQTTPIVESASDGFANDAPVQYARQERIGHGRLDVSQDDQTGEDQPTQQQMQTGESKHDLRPYFAGESEGLEFLFDLCCPDRTIRGLHYATPAHSYRAKRAYQRSANPSPLPSMAVQRELVRSFFLYLWPVLPVVDAKSFLAAFYGDDPNLSPLLLWSILFAAASFVDHGFLKTHQLGTRKQIKEQYYQNAKDIFDAQDEPDKTILIQSAILLGSSWYMDLEDRDGMMHWLGIAISLSFTMGLHRKDNYDSITPRPFSSSVRRLWKCLWWSIMYREAFLALGLGRPMRIDSENCDIAIPSVQEVFGPSLEGIPNEIRHELPNGTIEMAALWINLLELGLLLERVLKRHYRPRSVPASPAELQEEEGVILSCRDRLENLQISSSRVLTIHAAHLKTYYNCVLIALYRPYMHRHLKDEYEEVALKAKRAAASTTSVLNELISRDAIEVGPSMLITAMMSALQIYVWEVQNSSGVSRNYAYHHLDLYLMVMSHLGKTYWTADLQHNLFVEALKVMRGGTSSTLESNLNGVAHQLKASQGMDLPSTGTLDPSEGDNSLMHGSLEDFFLSFNPFMGLPMQPDELDSSIDLGLSPAGPLVVDNLHHGSP